MARVHGAEMKRRSSHELSGLGDRAILPTRSDQAARPDDFHEPDPTTFDVLPDPQVRQSFGNRRGEVIIGIAATCKPVVNSSS